MKKMLCITLIATLIAMSGCGSSSSDTSVAEDSAEIQEEESDEYFNDLQVQIDTRTDIEDYIKANIPVDISTLLANNWLTVYVGTDGDVNVTIRTIFYYAIPYIARDTISVVEEAIESAGATLGRFIVIYYEQNSEGTIDGTTSSWSTSNWESGIYVSEQDDLRLTNVTIDDLLDYYSDYAELIQNIKDDSE